MSERRSFREALSFGGLSFAFTAVIGVVSSIVIARVYGITVIGQYAIAAAPTGAMWFLSSVREQAALLRELAVLPVRAPRITGLFVAVFTFSVGLSIVVGALVALVTYLLLNGPIDQPDLFFPAMVNLGGYLVAANTSWNLDTIFNAFRAGRDLFWIRLRYAVGYLVIAVVLGLVWGTVMALTLATVGAMFLSLFRRLRVVPKYMLLRVPRSEIRDGFRTLPRLIVFGLKVAPGQMAHGIANETNVWILSAIAPVEAVGAYNRAWTLSQRFRDMNNRLTEVLLPTLVERRANRDDAGFSRAMIDSTRYASVATLLVAAVGGGAAQGIMTLFGPGFIRGADALALILLVPAVTATIGVQNNVLFADDRPLITSVVGVARLIVGVGLSILLIDLMGITGAALAILLGFVMTMLALFAVDRHKLMEPLRSLWPARQVIALGLAYGAGFVAARLVDEVLPRPAGLLLALPAGTIAYVLAFVGTGGFNERDRARIAPLVRRLRARGRPAAAP